MAKDPAFLFYPGDASNDTQFMNRLERGAYFDLMKAQRLFGGYTAVQLRKVLGSDFEAVWPALELVLQFDGEKYFIGWLAESISKRDSYSKKQSERVRARWNNDGNTAVLPKKENENENENENEVETEVKKEKPKKEKSEKPTNQIPIIQMEELWSKFLSDHHSVSYYASAKERVALKAIAKQLLFQVGQKEAQTGQISNKTDADKVLEAWSYVLSKFDRWSDFHKNLKALSAINSQLTTILSDSKNGANKQKSNGPLDPAKVAADYLRSRGIADPIDRSPAQNGPNETLDADYQIVD